MYELARVGDRSFFINCPAKIGLYLSDENSVWLIDSGNDKDAGKKAKQTIEKNGWVLRGIINTHSHADHIGGNRYLQEQTGCKVFAGGIEAAFTRYPVLEPSFLYGGNPPRELRHKFLMAQESRVSDFSDPDFPREVEIIALPGHCFDMVGFRTPDGTVFLADCLSSRATLEKYAVPYIYDVQAYLETLDMVQNMQAAVFVPSHAEPSSDLTELICFNRAKVIEIGEQVESFCTEPSGFDVILKRLFDHYGLTITFEQHVLIGSTLRSYLSWLKDSGRVEALFESNMLLWHKI
ncbi:MAG: MBL fold metallo-hydrolase [Clostridia bacterium]|nr:MBL fold metallo-hydrolase [Clostridia bacterium]